MVTHSLLERTRARLVKLDAEHALLIKLIALYEQWPPTAPRERHKRVPNHLGTGVTDRLLAVVDESPGLRYRELVQQAVVGLVTTSQFPDRLVGSILSTMVKRRAIVRIDGLHFAAT